MKMYCTFILLREMLVTESKFNIELSDYTPLKLMHHHCFVLFCDHFEVWNLIWIQCVMWINSPIFNLTNNFQERNLKLRKVIFFLFEINKVICRGTAIKISTVLSNKPKPKWLYCHLKNAVPFRLQKKNKKKQ